MEGYEKFKDDVFKLTKIDLDAYKEAISKKSSLIDCYWGELYGSINMAEISDGLITPEHAELPHFY